MSRDHCRQNLVNRITATVLLTSTLWACGSNSDKKAPTSETVLSDRLIKSETYILQPDQIYTVDLKPSQVIDYEYNPGGSPQSETTTSFDLDPSGVVTAETRYHDLANRQGPFVPWGRQTENPLDGTSVWQFHSLNNGHRIQYTFPNSQALVKIMAYNESAQLLTVSGPRLDHTVGCETTMYDYTPNGRLSGYSTVDSICDAGLSDMDFYGADAVPDPQRLEQTRIDYLQLTEGENRVITETTEDARRDHTVLVRHYYEQAECTDMPPGFVVTTLLWCVAAEQSGL